VYLGEDAARVRAAARTSPEYLGRFEIPLATPGGLRANATYAWRVDEVFADGSVQPGPVWSFHTAPSFRRGDADTNNALDIADVIFSLSYLFVSGPAPTCLDAADANDDGRVDLSDAIRVLLHLFARTGDLPEPFSQCDIDPTGDELGCGGFPPCE